MKNFLISFLFLCSSSAFASGQFTVCYGQFWLPKGVKSIDQSIKQVNDSLGKRSGMLMSSINTSIGTNNSESVAVVKVKYESTNSFFEPGSVKSQFKDSVKIILSSLGKKGDALFRMDGCAISSSLELDSDDYDSSKY